MTVLLHPRVEPKPHPAAFSEKVMEEIIEVVQNAGGGRPLKILDPFAGIGGVHKLRRLGHDTVGVELEPEWAADSHPHTIVGSALALPFDDGSFDCVVTSPCYGNRMADHHEAKDDSKRITYRHYLGRPLSDGNAGALQWGDDYRLFHADAWHEVVRVLQRGGLFVLNISNHVRGGEVQAVTEWHTAWLLGALRLRLIEARRIPTPRMRYGANRALRVAYESLVVIGKP